MSEYEIAARSEEAFRLQSRREIDREGCPFECAADAPECGCRDAAAFAPLLSADQTDALRDAISDAELIASLERENAALRDENRALYRLAAFADHCRPTCASLPPRSMWLRSISGRRFEWLLWGLLLCFAVNVALNVAAAVGEGRRAAIRAERGTR